MRGRCTASLAGLFKAFIGKRETQSLPVLPGKRTADYNSRCLRFREHLEPLRADEPLGKSCRLLLEELLQMGHCLVGGGGGGRGGGGGGQAYRKPV